MKIDILTLFPEMFVGPFDMSMLKKARDIGAVEIKIHNLRKWAKDKHKTVDDRPFGGGKGMILKVNVLFDAIGSIKNSKTPNIQNSKKKDEVLRLASLAQDDHVKRYKQSNVKIVSDLAKAKSQKSHVLLLSPQGKVFNQKKAQELSKLEHLILIAGHYEGFDERIRKHLVDEEISIGDYVLTGGELPAMVIVDSVVRLLPNVLDNEATKNESFSLSTKCHLPSAILDYPQYTRPENFKGWKVPKILLSGNHAEITKWRKEKALAATKKKRPDLI